MTISALNLHMHVHTCTNVLTHTNIYIYTCIDRHMDTTFAHENGKRNLKMQLNTYQHHDYLRILLFFKLLGLQSDTRLLCGDCGGGWAGKEQTLRCTALSVLPFSESSSSLKLLLQTHSEDLIHLYPRASE